MGTHTCPQRHKHMMPSLPMCLSLGGVSSSSVVVQVRKPSMSSTYPGNSRLTHAHVTLSQISRRLLHAPSPKEYPGTLLSIPSPVPRAAGGNELLKQRLQQVLLNSLAPSQIVFPFPLFPILICSLSCRGCSNKCDIW